MQDNPKASRKKNGYFTVMLSKLSIINIILRLKFSFGCNSVTSSLHCICVHCTVYKARSKDGSGYWEKYPGQAGCKKCPDQDEVTIVRLLSNDQCPIVHPAISGHTSDLTSMDDTRIDEKLKKIMWLHSISHCVFCVRVGISDSLCSEWVAGPPTIEVIKACGNVFFFFVSSKRHIWPMPVHIGLRLTQALDRCRAQPYSIQIDTRLSFLHIRSQLRSLTVGDQAYSKSNVPKKTPLRLSPRKTG